MSKEKILKEVQKGLQKEMVVGNGEDDELTMTQRTHDKHKQLAKNVVAQGGRVTIDDTPNTISDQVEDVVKEDDKEEFKDPDLIPDKEKTEREYDEFETVMKELAEKNGPKIDIAENINPRIKKSDLEDYLNKNTK
jgi:hypothetical protein